MKEKKTKPNFLFYRLRKKKEMSKIAGYDTHDDGPGFVGIRFCQECNNMLYPKENKENKVLMYAVSIEIVFYQLLFVKAYIIPNC